MTGNITRRGKSSWRSKFEAGERDRGTDRRRLTQYASMDTCSLTRTQMLPARSRSP
jgi:hypothetical protein